MSVLFHNYSPSARRQLVNLLAGGLAGLAASIPMALVMMSLNRFLPKREYSPLPPKQITAEVARRTGVEESVPPGRSWGPATWLAHLGYGAATASLYPAITRPLPFPAVLRGMLFALLIWAGSYLGWLPALDILPSAAQQPARRNTIMILSHLVWGSLLGLLTGRIAQQVER